MTVSTFFVTLDPIFKIYQKIDWKRSLEQVDASSQGKPLQVIADPRFHWISSRAAKRRARVSPIKSARSSFSTASIVSSSYLKSPEPDENQQIQSQKYVCTSMRFNIFLFDQTQSSTIIYQSRCYWNCFINSCNYSQRCFASDIKSK